MEIINLSNVTYLIEKKTLFSIKKISIDSHEKIALIGNNGTGKSTLAKMIIGEIENQNIQINSQLSIGYLPQMNTGLNLSGGELVKERMLRLFEKKYDFLILDEPTPNLDLKNREWLMNKLKNFRGGLLLISHDRTFIQSLTDNLLYFENKKLYRFYGSVEALEKNILNNRMRQLNKYNNHRKEISRLTNELLRKKDRAKQITKKKRSVSQSDWKVNSKLGRYNAQSKALNKSAANIETRIAKMPKVLQPSKDFNVKLRSIGSLQQTNDTLISLKPGTVSIDKRSLFHYPALKLKFGDHVVLTGANGAGKTTFLKKIMNRALNDSYYSPKLSIGYFSQNTANLDEDKSIIENVSNTTQQDQKTTFNLLAGLGFSNKDIKKKVMQTSGGERARVELSKILLGDYNLLLLDEPTNFLDIHMIQSLIKFIHFYPGSIILISHERTIINNSTTRWDISKHHLIDVTKDYHVENHDDLDALRFQRDLMIQNGDEKIEEILKIQKEIKKLENNKH